MNAAQVESALQALIKSYTPESLPYDLLLAYGQPKSSVTRLQKGTLNLSNQAGEIIWKKKLYYKSLLTQELHSVFKAMLTAKPVISHNPQFVIASDGKSLLAQDTKTGDKLDIAIAELPKNYDFFLPWAGMGKNQVQSENPADVKAAERMAKLYVEIGKTNVHDTKEQVHSLNVFLSRLLFCFFAEDTQIFKDGQFSSAIASHTQQDGSDLAEYLNTLFKVLNQPDSKRSKDLPHFLAAFPYVNGGLFNTAHAAPVFSRKSRQMLIESGELDWAGIHPDIFGSMIQAVVDTDYRGSLGMHYTSVPNIMKVIEPLLLNELNVEFEAAKNSPVKLNKLLDRLAKIKIFDPACGSGNFLIIAYKELRLFEIKVVLRLKELSAIATGQTGFEDKGQLDLIPKAQQTLAAAAQAVLFSRIELSQFYGIELDDFAHEIAILSLWLAEHQMNLKFKKEIGECGSTLPLKPGGNIVQGNATRLNWEEICPKDGAGEVFILGNPPYLGSRKQKAPQKDDLSFVLSGLPKYKDLDYISCWFYKGAKYIEDTNHKVAFVSTNSICQGEQVSLIWPTIFEKGLEIFFAYNSFKWRNNAKDVAGVSVIIVGIQRKRSSVKTIVNKGITQNVPLINAYLLSGSPDVFVYSRSKPLSDLPEMNFGNMPADGGNFLFSTQAKLEFIQKEPKAEKWFKRLINASEYLNGRERWCLWLEDITQKELIDLPFVQEVVEQVRLVRIDSSRPHLAKTSHLFAQITQPANSNCLIVPRVSSENRIYLPIDYLDGQNKVTDSFFTVVTDRIDVFGILISRMHMVWLETVGGKLETRYQYSKNVVYNTFPIPQISIGRKSEIEQLVMAVIEQREQHSEKTLGQLYDSEKMPIGLRTAHHALDLAIDKCYRSKPFASDEERLEVLFALYKQMIEEERTAGELFVADKTKKKAKAAR